MKNRKYMKTHEHNWTLNNWLHINTNDNNQTPWFNSNRDSNDRMDPVNVSATVAREVENAVMAASMKRSYNWPPPEAPPAVNSLKVSESFICFRFNMCHSIIFSHIQSEYSIRIFNHIQSYSIIFNHIQPYSIIFNHIQSYSIIFNHIQSYSIIFNHIQSYSIIFNLFWLFTDFAHAKAE